MGARALSRFRRRNAQDCAFFEQVRGPQRAVGVAYAPEALRVAEVLPGDVVEPLFASDTVAHERDGLHDEARRLEADDATHRIRERALRDFLVAAAFEEHQAAPYVSNRLRRPAAAAPGRLSCARLSFAFW